MKHRIISVTALITAGLLASSSVFADTKFRPRADIGLASYELSISDPGFDDITSESTYLKAGIGGTIITGRWYFDLGYSGSINAESDESGGGTSDFTRKDLTLTAGYVFPNNVAVFGGYKSGTSEFENFSDIPGFSDEFTADGIYGGAGYNIKHGNNVISFNGAIAILEGEYKSSDSSGSFSYTSDTVGLSLGAGYNIPLSSASGIAIKANYQNYTFTDLSASDGTSLSGEDSEEILAFDVGYYATF